MTKNRKCGHIPISSYYIINENNNNNNNNGIALFVAKRTRMHEAIIRPSLVVFEICSKFIEVAFDDNIITILVMDFGFVFKRDGILIYV